MTRCAPSCPPRRSFVASDARRRGQLCTVPTRPESTYRSGKTVQTTGTTSSHTGRTKAYCLREIIERGIEEMQDYYLAADVLERVRKGQEQVHSAADVRRDLGLDV